MKKIAAAVFGILCLAATTDAFAIVLNGEYSVSLSLTPIDADSWIFTYTVTNYTQQSAVNTGLDGFYLQVPATAVISNVTNPAGYSGGFWANNVSSDPSPMSSIGGNGPEAVLLPGNIWLTWWGNDPRSVYPQGTSATFSFRADGVSVGNTTASPISYWGWSTPVSPALTTNWGRYTVFSTTLNGPVAPVPEPASLALLGMGLVGLLARKRKLVKVV